LPDKHNRGEDTVCLLMATADVLAVGQDESIRFLLRNWEQYDESKMVLFVFCGLGAGSGQQYVCYPCGAVRV
jgi:hypothetical protein